MKCCARGCFKYNSGQLGERLVEILGLGESFLYVLCERSGETLGEGLSEILGERFGEMLCNRLVEMLDQNILQVCFR